MAKKAAYYQIAKMAYIYEGKTLGEIFLTLDEAVSERTLERWSAEGGWAIKRAEYLRGDQDFRARLEQLKKLLLERALETGDPQTVYALARIEAVSRPTAAERLREIEEKQAETKAGGLTPEAVEEIRKKVLGL